MTPTPCLLKVFRPVLLLGTVILSTTSAVSAAPNPFQGVWETLCMPLTENPQYSVKESLVLGEQDAFVLVREQYNEPHCSGTLVGNQQLMGTYEAQGASPNQAEQHLGLSLLQQGQTVNTQVRISVYGETLQIQGDAPLLSNDASWSRIFQRQIFGYLRAKQ